MLGLPSIPPCIPVEEEAYAAFPAFDVDAQLRKRNLWGHVDGRDGAQAAHLALESQATGLDRFVVAAADTVMSRDDMELVAAWSPRHAGRSQRAAPAPSGAR